MTLASFFILGEPTSLLNSVPLTLSSQLVFTQPTYPVNDLNDFHWVVCFNMWLNLKLSHSQLLVQDGLTPARSGRSIACMFCNRNWASLLSMYLPTCLPIRSSLLQCLEGPKLFAVCYFCLSCCFGDAMCKSACWIWGMPYQGFR